MKKIVVSGIRPTGNLHLGNYFGALRNFIRMQDEYNCYFFIADYHSLTTHPHPDHLRQNVKQILASYIACGMDPEKVAIYAQSDLPETAELYMFFNMNVYLGELMLREQPGQDSGAGRQRQDGQVRKRQQRHFPDRRRCRDSQEDHAGHHRFRTG